jgi:methyl-accepting chemotaxis protein
MAEVDGKNVRAVVREFDAAVEAAVAQTKGDLERAKMMVRDATAHLGRSFDALRSAADSQRAALQTVTSSLVDVGNGGRSFASSTETLMRQFVDEIVRVSRDSVRIIEQLADLAGHVSAIGGSADAIDGLARETRFIAFNARIETHRAGEAGRTFKVVADEVKRLANASSTLSSQIRQSVGECTRQLTLVHRTSTGLASHDLSQAIESHRGLSASIGRLDSVNRDLDQMLEIVSSSVADAVRALQFEDMVTQILSATIARVEKLGACCSRAVKVMEQGTNGDRAAPLAEVVSQMRSLSDRLAVQQNSVEQGSVELF